MQAFLGNTGSGLAASRGLRVRSEKSAAGISIGAMLKKMLKQRGAIPGSNRMLSQSASRKSSGPWLEEDNELETRSVLPVETESGENLRLEDSAVAESILRAENPQRAPIDPKIRNAAAKLSSLLVAVCGEEEYVTKEGRVVQLEDALGGRASCGVGLMGGGARRSTAHYKKELPSAAAKPRGAPLLAFGGSHSAADGGSEVQPKFVAMDARARGQLDELAQGRIISVLELMAQRMESLEERLERTGRLLPPTELARGVTLYAEMAAAVSSLSHAAHPADSLIASRNSSPLIPSTQEGAARTHYASNIPGAMPSPAQPLLPADSDPVGPTADGPSGLGVSGFSAEVPPAAERSALARMPNQNGSRPVPPPELGLLAPFFPGDGTWLTPSGVVGLAHTNPAYHNGGSRQSLEISDGAH